MKQHIPIIAFAVTIVAVGSWLASRSTEPAPPVSSTDPLPSVAATGPAPKSDSGLAPVGDLVGGLEQRLQQNPDDGKGWLLLAKSYQYLGRLDEAREAYKKADDLGQGDAMVAAQLNGEPIAAQ